MSAPSPTSPSPGDGKDGVPIDTNILLDEIGRDHTADWLERMQLRAAVRQMSEQATQQADRVRYLESLQQEGGS